jgi:hypothetical protein
MFCLNKKEIAGANGRQSNTVPHGALKDQAKKFYYFAWRGVFSLYHLAKCSRAAFISTYFTVLPADYVLQTEPLMT